MKNLFKLSLIAFLMIFATSCSDDDNGDVMQNGNDTIAVFVQNNEDYSSLLAALERAGLVETLNGATEYTVFAPNNAAFAAFLNANGFASLEDVPVDVLTNILLNHVVAGTNNSGDLTTGYINSLATFGTTTNNLSLFIDTSAGVRINNVSSVTTPDVAVSNGVIHAVDAVIGIPTIVTQATANGDFSILVEALIAASDSNIDYVALLSGSASSPFTVFAPNNTAFENLLTTLGFASLNDIPQPVLQLVLNYHVIAGANVRAEDLTEGQVATTFQGEDITISLANGPQIIDATGMPSNIIVTNVQTGNGVIHAIDKVLLPQEVLDIVDPTIAGLAMMTADLSTLAEALSITGLDTVLDDRTAEYTVFAPGNAAFDTFLGDNGFATINDVPVDVLTQVVLNHALTGIALSGGLSTSYTTTLATYGTSDNNLSLYINTDSGVTLNGISNVVTPDVTAANGVVHIVDAVIALPTVVTFAVADPTFETLVAALTRADQPDFVSVLSTPLGTSPAPFTVFAPTNDAFGDLLVELGISSLDDIDTATLTATLNTHVIPGANVRAEDLVDGPVGTLGDDIIIDASNATITDQNGRVSNIIVVNVQAANGVVHAIDKVLLPQ
ncbi:MAG: fasciclin domain-containing protein [Bacteroidia bacterium]|nr:fasciclin domain-containing protein [Bacteroidia bacterium]NNF31106.1 fasciclin domain-containing protein [Flavobacteriaceae bacterium]NNJ81309.1 fasciclin domain-containing protein [Flavobacteriaceae bacterium]NNK55568.1 fasciclin domain-containing protein [Flavobacteriaceae bacterium]NNM08858.1 fasciclin domain-containing protein [Flavobacteriaceae bacterium]